MENKSNQLKANYQFEKAHACLLVRADGSLFIQVIDAYAFQREMVLTSNEQGGTVHVYQHPGRREIVQIKRALFDKLTAKLLEYAAKYPNLLFNEGNAQFARCEGFVHLCEWIFRGGEQGVADYVRS